MFMKAKQCNSLFTTAYKERHHRVTLWPVIYKYMVDIIHYAKARFLLLIPHTKIWFRNFNCKKDYEYIWRCHNWTKYYVFFSPAITNIKKSNTSTAKYTSMTIKLSHVMIRLNSC